MKLKNDAPWFTYIGLSSQLLVFIAISVYGGIKLDEQFRLSPLCVVALPLLVLSISFIKSSRKPEKRKIMQEKTDKNFKGMQLMVLVFVLLNACFLILKGAMTSAGLEIYVLLIANLVLFLVGFFTLRNGLKSIQNPNPHVFVRVFYSGFLIRLLACGTAAFVYIYMNNGRVSERTLFACMGIYMAYSAIEVATLQKALKENKNA